MESSQEIDIRNIQENKSNVRFQYNKLTYLLHKTFLLLFPYYLTLVINKTYTLVH